MSDRPEPLPGDFDPIGDDQKDYLVGALVKVLVRLLAVSRDQWSIDYAADAAILRALDKHVISYKQEETSREYLESVYSEVEGSLAE